MVHHSYTTRGTQHTSLSTFWTSTQHTSTSTCKTQRYKGIHVFKRKKYKGTRLSSKIRLQSMGFWNKLTIRTLSTSKIGTILWFLHFQIENLSGKYFFKEFLIENDLKNSHFLDFFEKIHDLTHEPYKSLYTLVPELTHESYFKFEIHEHEQDLIRVVCCGVRYREHLWWTLVFYSNICNSYRFEL